MIIIMSFTQYNSISRSSKNLFRERSISSLPSRQISVMNIINERESSILHDKKKGEEEKSVVLIKDTEISKLRRNLETAVSTALYEKLENSKNKEELNEYTHLRRHLDSKIKLYEKDLKVEKENNAVFKIKNEELASIIDDLNKNIKQLEAQVKEKSAIIQSTKGLPQEIEQLKSKLKDIEPLKQRIIVLQEQIRQEKLSKISAEKKVKASQQQIDSLQKQLATVKPREQSLRERIAYFERVNLDLQRKMEDYNRRENDYIKQLTALKQNLTKVTSERNFFKTVYEETTQNLEKKIMQYDTLIEQHNEKIGIIHLLQLDLQAEKKVTSELKHDIQGKNQFYKRQGQENIALNQKNKLLQAQELELRKVIDGYLRIADEVNLTLTANIEEIKKLKQMIENVKIQLHKTEEKFDQFDKFVEQGSQKGFNQIRDNFYSLLRANNDLTTLVKQQRIAFDEKIMVFGQERDSILRNNEVRNFQPPTDETQYQTIFYQKTESMLLLQKSNDQLLQIKKQLENKIQELYGEIQKQKKEMSVLKLKTADLFRAKKDLEDARKSIQRYQEMIEEDKQVIEDIKSQVSVLRQRNTDLNEKNFVAELDKRNLEVKVKEMNEIMKELNVQTLMTHKQINQKNSHLMVDSLQKLQSAIKSLTFYFNCAFCGELPTTPVTLALCGHTYCTKCKEAYAESCYECDTGQPIEKVFQNKFLKDAGGKYKFLTMVLSELRANFNKKQ